MAKDVDFLQAVQKFIIEHGLFDADERVAVGVSGGVDSMVMLATLQELGYSVIAIHINHGLREKAGGDEEFVREEAEELGVPFRSSSIDPTSLAESTATSLQDAGRTLRYDALVKVAHEEGARYIAAAHHLDDQAETVLLQLFRGGGPEALAAMAPARPLDSSGVTLVRPLLEFRRKEIEAFAAERGIAWREDETNAETKYLRNAIRHELMPVIERHFGEETPVNIARSADYLRQYLAAGWADELQQRFDDCRSGDRALDVAALEAQPEVWRGRILIEVLRRWAAEVRPTRGMISEIGDLMRAQSGKKVELGGGAVWRDHEQLVFEFPQDAPNEGEGGGEGGDAAPLYGQIAMGEIRVLPQGKIEVSRVEKAPADLTPSELAREAPECVYLDVDGLTGPLTVRPWQSGDAMIPFGDTYSKNISDLLTDAKVPSHTRDQALVVCDEEKIVWLVGIRLSEEVRITGRTRSIVRLNVEDSSNKITR